MAKSTASKRDDLISLFGKASSEERALDPYSRALSSVAVSAPDFSKRARARRKSPFFCS